MSGFTQSGFATLKTTLLIGVLVATPVVALLTHIEKTSASDDKNVCVTAKLKSNPSISYSYGNCYTAPIVIPSEEPSPEPVVTQSPEPSDTLEPEPAVTATPEPTINPQPTSDPTVAPTPTAEPTLSPEPTSTPTVSPSPTPTYTPDTIESPTPAPTDPVPPEPDPIPIPPENTDPKTQEFRFCHLGAMHSNSFTGMMNGHHDKHDEDIIPPIPFKFYGGWNWNSTNAKTYYNNCIPVK